MRLSTWMCTAARLGSVLCLGLLPTVLQAQVVTPPATSSLQFSTASTTVAENGGLLTLTVTRTGGIGSLAAVNWSTRDGTASAGSDFSLSGNSLIWDAGDATPKTFIIAIRDDSLLEDDETFSVVLSAPAGNGTLGTPSEVAVTITEDDIAFGGTLQFSSTVYDVGESAGNARISVTRGDSTDGAVSVDYRISNGTAESGSDYGPGNGTLTWLDGDSAPKTLEVPILDDGVTESAETVLLLLINPIGGAVLAEPANATLTIADDDVAALPGTLRFAVADLMIDEGGGSATISVSRVGGADGAVSVDYATRNGTASDGEDYTGTSGRLFWPDGDGSAKTFAVPILEDALDEGNETVELMLDNAGGGASLGRSAATVTIVDNDDAAQAGILQFASEAFNVTEGVGQAAIAITRSGGTEGAVSVQLTVTLPETGTRVFSVSYADGEGGAQIFSLLLPDDDRVEPDRVVPLMLSDPSGGAALGSPVAATLTIAEDDVATGTPGGDGADGADGAGGGGGGGGALDLGLLGILLMLGVVRRALKGNCA